MSSSYLAKYNSYINKFNQELDITLSKINNVPDILHEAMSYAVVDGGKRIRPVLCFAVAEILGIDSDLVKEFAIAIELIHSYSLVHDDLPAMDNDDFRRGKLSTHKKFGEALGILAGDSLLNLAFQIVLSKKSFSSNDVKALKLLSEYAGSSGMIAGQVLDLANEKSKDYDENTLYSIYENKTAKLIMAPILISSIIANDKFYSALKNFGYNLGIMFQISDDLLDAQESFEVIGKTPGKDAKSDKLTAVKIFGIDGALKRKEFHYNTCINELNKINGADFLIDLTNKLFERKK